MKSTNALDWACDLEKSGMPNEQAVAVAQVFHESHETLMENMREMIATSHDNVIKAVDKLEGEIRSKHRWVIGLIIGVNGLTIGVIGLMFGAVLRILSQTS